MNDIKACLKMSCLFVQRLIEHPVSSGSFTCADDQQQQQRSTHVYVYRAIVHCVFKPGAAVGVGDCSFLILETGYQVALVGPRHPVCKAPLLSLQVRFYCCTSDGCSPSVLGSL